MIDPCDITDGRLRPLADVVAECEREWIEFALVCADGRPGRAARLLGVSRKLLWERMRRHGVTVTKFDVVAGEEVLEVAEPEDREVAA